MFNKYLFIEIQEIYYNFTQINYIYLNNFLFLHLFIIVFNQQSYLFHFFIIILDIFLSVQIKGFIDFIIIIAIKALIWQIDLIHLYFIFDNSHIWLISYYLIV